MERIGFVLIHGAGLGSWVWDKTIPELKAPALAVDLPGRGEDPKKYRDTTLGDYVQSVKAEIESFPVEKLILVGHSFAGQIVLRLATLMPERIASLVFVSAVLPPSGKSMIDLQPWPGRLVKNLVLRFASTRPPEAVIRAVSCSDLDQPTCAQVIARYSPESPHVYLDPVEWKLPDTLPRTYIKTLKDRSVVVKAQERMIANVQPVRTLQIQSGHIPMLGKPKELAGLLNQVLERL